MLMDLCNFLVWLATVDYVWIPAGISVISLFSMWKWRKWSSTDDGVLLVPICAVVCFVLWFGVLASSYEPAEGVPSRFPHFLLWHLVALGAAASGIVGWFVAKSFEKLWGHAKNFVKTIFGKWQSKRNYLKNIRGTEINEELELRRKELEKLMDGGAISESIRGQVASLFGGPFQHLLSVRQFLLENVEIFDAAEARALKNSAASAETKKEISERRGRLNKTLGDVNARLSQIAVTVDGLIIRMGEIRAGLGQGSADVEATLSELNEMVSAIEDGVLETQKIDDAGAPNLPERITTEELSSAISPAREGVKA